MKAELKVRLLQEVPAPPTTTVMVRSCQKVTELEVAVFVSQT